jgi:pimeloyl-ACP methyl ester carboxylesterase
VPIAAAVATVASLITTTASAAPAETDTSAASHAVVDIAAFHPVIHWKPCTDDFRYQVECGDLVVPVDWYRPNGPTVTLSLVRKKATDTQHRLGTVVLGPGGPGLSGVGMVGNSMQFSTDVQSRYDVIGYDSRGIGESDPITCDTTGLTVPTAYPTDEQQFQQIVRFNQAYFQSCRRLTGPVFDHLDTLSNARDMEALRIALGEDKLSFYGASYGTMLGQTYAMLYPNRVGRWVLDSNMDHSVPTAYDFLHDETAAGEQTLDDFFQWCDANTSCALHSAGARQTFTSVYAMARKAGTDRVLALVNLASVESAAPNLWPQLAQELLREADGQSTGDPLPPWQPDPNAAILCSDWNLPIPNFAAWETIVHRLAATSPNLKISWQAIAESDLLDCVGSTIRTRFPQQRLNWNGTPPILMVDTVHDVRTPFDWGATAARQGGGDLLTDDGYGHSVYFPNYHDCVDDAVDDYFLTGATPPAGTHCPDREPTP